MLRWLLFFLVILTAIATFVAFVLGIPIPFVDQLHPPDSPFAPAN